MPAPTFVTEVETAWNSSTTPKTTASISVQVGDILIAYAAKDANSDNLSTPTNSGTALTWTLQQSVDTASRCEVRIWTATATAAESITVSFASTGGAGEWFGGAVQVWRSSDGVGASAAANAAGSAPTLNITTTQANSAIAVLNADWEGADGASRAWRANAGTLTETTYFHELNRYTVYAGYHADAGSIGTYAVGLTTPSQTYAIVAVEIKGSAGGNSGQSQLGQLTSQGQSVRVGRLYFPAATAAPVGVSPDAGWNYTSERLERSFALIKGSSAIAIGTQVGPWTATAGQTALDRTYVSPPLAAQEISGTVSMQLMVREYAGTDNVDQVRLVIKVVSNDGGTVRATLYSGNGSTTAEFVNNVTHRNFTAASALALSSYTCVAGDRIAVEIGYRNSTAGTTPEASAKWGENATVLPVNNTQTTDGAPWIDFSNGLEFAALTGTATPNLGTPTSAASGAPVVTGSAAPQQGALTSEGSGSVGGSIDGSAADDLGSLASAAQGSPVGTGSAAPDLGAATSQASGSPAGTGSAADQLGALATSAASGSPVGTGSAAAQLGDLTSAASGSTGSGVEGTAADQLGDLTSAAQGSPAGTGSAADQLGDAASAGAGAPVVAGAAADQAGAATSVATGSPLVTGTAAGDAGAPTSAASGAPTITGQGASLAGDATSAASGTSVLQGSAADQAGAATSAGAGAPVVTGSGATALGDLTSQGQEGAISGSAADALGPLASAGQGSPVGTGAAAGPLGTLTGAASGTPITAGIAAGSIGDLVSGAAGSPIAAGSAANQSGVAASAGAGSPVVPGQGAGPLGDATSAATGAGTITGNVFTDLGQLVSDGTGSSGFVQPLDESLPWDVVSLSPQRSVGSLSLARSAAGLFAARAVVPLSARRDAESLVPTRTVEVFRG